ncbi:MAG TPA: TauD/TfdA family dioxygenase [Thermoanaerobaculia bacterium]|nr:TauD/TfdA family dioxygenase [Thermoanaerobaculia bacterium]
MEPKSPAFSRFRRVEPKPVVLPEGDLVTERFLEDGSTFPLLIEPKVPDLDLAGWAASQLPWLEERVHRHGAILFRGFGVPDVAAFEGFAAAICGELYGEYGDLPHAGDGKKVYNSTPYPPDKTILFHNESSHTPQWPLRQFFFCVQKAAGGGETPIVDCRRIFQMIDPEVRERFARLGLLYVRNFTPGLDVSWQDFFRTDDPALVERICRENDIELEWRGDSLRTRQQAPAVAQHPATGESLFFNQIQLHHVSCMEPEVRRSLAELFSEEELPRNVYYGDGATIPDEVVQHTLDVYWRAAVAAPWEEGDVLMLDNMLVAHARNPYTPPRRIAVAMGRMFRREQLQTA